MSAIKELTEVYRRETENLKELLRKAGLEECQTCGKWVDPWEETTDGECQECHNNKQFNEMFS